MRIIADKPIELLRGLVNEHLTRVVTLDGYQWMSDDSKPVPDASRFVTIPTELRTMSIHSAFMQINPADFAPVDLRALNARLILNGPEGTGIRYDVVAAFGPDDPGSQDLLLVTSDGTIVFAVHTNAAIHADGVIQIRGAEAGVALLTIAQLRADRGKKLLYSGSSVNSFGVERRADGGPWYPVDIRFNASDIALRDVRAD